MGCRDEKYALLYAFGTMERKRSDHFRNIVVCVEALQLKHREGHNQMVLAPLFHTCEWISKGLTELYTIEASKYTWRQQ